VLANAFFASTVILLAFGFWVFQECTFLVPYRQLILSQYGSTIATYASLLFLNLLAGTFTVSRRFFLKDTGRKLAHLEKQLRSRQSISEELSERIAGEE
jgi:hypothetical protein